MAKLPGISTALAAVKAEVARRHAAGEQDVQLLLLPTPVPDGAEQGEALPEGFGPGSGKRGPGRPPGAKNRSTIARIEALRARYRSPLQVLAEIWSRPLPQLAAELGCTLLEAEQEVRLAASAALPYWESRLTPEQITELTQQLQVLLVQSAEGARQAAQAGVAVHPPVLRLIHSDQRVSPPPPPELDAPQLDEAR